jgi:ribosomal protein S18 acetylase RimI-like enzyme
MSAELNIRRAETKDLALLVAFNQAMAQETENKLLPDETITAGARAVLGNPHHGFYLVAETLEKEVVGGLMVTFEWSDWRNAQFWWIQSVYVLPKFRGQGVYRQLYQKVKDLARTNETKVCGFRLYVEKENIIAQTVYKNLGMEESHYLMFEEMQNAQ